MYKLTFYEMQDEGSPNTIKNNLHFTLYPKLGLSPTLASEDFLKKKQILDNCYQLGMSTTVVSGTAM